MKRGIGKNKKGEFYIIAAIIIIALLAGMYALRNYVVTKKEYTQVYDLKEELKIETGKVYDYGIYQGEDIDNLTESWANNYSEYAKGRAVEDWVFVYGNEAGLTAVTFSSVSTGGFGIVTNTVQLDVPITVGHFDIQKKSSSGKKVDITFQDFTHTFDLKPGQNFFCVIKGGEYTAAG